jgi:hypothetical protein
VKHIERTEPVAGPELDRRAALLLELIAQGERDFAEGRTVSHAAVRREFQRRISELRANE